MNRAEWEEQYKKECYRPLFKAYAEGISQGLLDHAKEINQKLNSQVEAFFTSLCMLQERGKLAAVQAVCISFPYTSLACGRPYLLFEAYAGIPFLDRAAVFREFDVPWLLEGWEGFVQKLREEAGRQGMNAVIRLPYIKSHAWNGARLLLHFLANVVKYHLYGLEKIKSLQQLGKADDFFLSFGEYMDWQLPIWIAKKETDIFFCEKDTDLRFCRFNKAWYEGKTFGGLVLDDCGFQECTFLNCQFQNVSLRDVRFIGCTFQNCCFTGADIAGARFDGCRLENIQMQDTRTACSIIEGMEILPEALGMTEFLGCFFISVELEKCDFSEGYFNGCRMEAVQTKDCQLSESFLNAAVEGGIL